MAQNAKAKIEFRGFVQITLDEKDITVLEQTLLTDEQLYDWLALILKSGYKFSVSQDDKTQPVKAMLQDVWSNRTSAGWMLSSEGETLSDAMTALRYKHEVKMGSDWVPFLEQKRPKQRYR